MDDSSDEIEPCQQIEPHELEETVKSKAVMKFSPVQVPANFNRLECNTNLNLPPSNWLTTSDSSHGLHQALYQSAGFASFRLGHMFPDSVGEVDVVSDAENIKKLLKLPYTSKGAISMVVHKVGNNTLLLDEFDIKKYLLRKADDDWKWLRQFIMDHVIAYGEKETNYCIKDKSREALQNKNLLSKFLYYSLKQSSSSSKDDSTFDENLDTATTTTSTTTASSSGSKSPPSVSLSSPVLPEAKEEVHVPDPKSGQAFNRNVVWTFEDIRMLVGTNFPIFGGKNRPCVSLRLRDMRKPINVLTGIDYWLDNLMCNVPEVVMCFHLDGIVQKYEIIKTEDLPYLENSQFSPQVVRNVAQSILSFLKANATKAGHTYWLFKGRNDDVVKLYDLTTLCKNQADTDDEAEKHANPFTVPVAMLLYKVAQNMKRSVQIKPKAAGNIRALLDNCIKLLPKEKYPQIVTSSHYILSDLYIPAGIDPKSPNFDEHESDDQSSVYDEDFIEEEQEPDGSEFDESFEQSSGEADVAMLQICDTLKNFKPYTKQSKPVPLVASTEERCSNSLQHISAGLSCLQYFNAIQENQILKETETRAKEEEKQRIIHEEKTPFMAKSMNVIPLPYESLQPKQSKQLEVTENDIAEKTKQNKTKLKLCKIKEIKETKASPVVTVAASNDASAGSANVIPIPSNNKQQLMENFNKQHFGSWNVHLKLLLLEKACLTYATIAECNFEAKRYGGSLNAIYVSYRCQQVVSKYISNITSQRSCLLGRAGDCLFQMAKNWQTIEEYLNQFKTDDDYTRIIKAELDKEVEEADTGLTMPVQNIEELMSMSCKCYEEALECGTSETGKHELLRRLGNVRNELGLKYMYWAQDCFSSALVACNHNAAAASAKATGPYIVYAKKCYECLQRGIEAFTAVQDNVNLAFLFCNMGRFMRMRAHFVLENNSISMTKRKAFYSHSFDYYERARNVLDTRKLNAELWDLVNWELSTATFTFAKQLQDFSKIAYISFSDASKEVLDLLQKSLKQCDVTQDSPRQVLYMFRAGLVHKRLASFHYSQLRANCLESVNVPKTSLQLCRYHYEKAANIFDSLKESDDYLTVQIERISLNELLANRAINMSTKMKHTQNLLDIFLQSESIFEYTLHPQSPLDVQPTDGALKSAQNAEAKQMLNATENVIAGIKEEEFLDNMILFESRLEITLKTLLKLSLTGKDPKKLSDLYKKMYMETLNGKRVADEQKLTVASKAEYLLNLLKRLNEIYDDN